MTSPIAPIAAIAPLGDVGAAAATPAASATSGSDFAAALGHGLDAVTGAQNTADGLAVQAATGQLVDPAQGNVHHGGARNGRLRLTLSSRDRMTVRPDTFMESGDAF